DEESGVAQDDRPGRERNAHDVEGRTQRDAGNDARKRDREDEEKRDRLPAKEAGARKSGRRKGAEDKGKDGGEERHFERQPKRRPDVGPVVPSGVKPMRGQARRWKLEALLLGREGIEKDKRQRQMQEKQPAGRAHSQRPSSTG